MIRIIAVCALVLNISTCWALSVEISRKTFAVESSRQTDSSVLLEWETDNSIRSLRSSPKWEPVQATPGTHILEIVDDEGRGGSSGARIIGTVSTDNARACYIQNMEQSLASGRYSYRLFYRSSGQQEGGRSRILIDCYTGDERTYHTLVLKDLPEAQDWTEISGTCDLPEDTQLVRCLLYQMGIGTSWFDDVSLSSVNSDSNLLSDSGFDGQGSWRVLFRKKGESEWQEEKAVVLERFYNVILLEPATDYEFMVRRLAPDGNTETDSQILTASTQPPMPPRDWNGFQLGSDVRVPAADPALYPCVESVNGKLYLMESRGGVRTLSISELDDQFKPRWTKQWVGLYYVEGQTRYQGQSQTAVLGDKIYMSWKRAYDGDAPHARQCVISYDTRTDEIGEIYTIEPDDPNLSTWNGGIAVLNGKLWISYCLWEPEGNSYRTRVTVRTLDYEAREMGPAYELQNQPTETPYTPFLSTFNDDLVVCFSDKQYVDMQPLWLVRFDGQQFHDLMTISPTGYNQYAKGVQVGDRLMLVWKYGAPYLSKIYGRYMFHDIGLALVDLEAGTVETTSLVNDIKYNSSPDIVWHNDQLIYTYGKFEHVYGQAGDPAENYGSFIGTITPDAE